MTDQIPLPELLKATANGDREAFADVYTATRAKLYGVILRILKRNDWADEVLQDAYLSIWNHADSYRPGNGTPMTWMISIARNCALDQPSGVVQPAGRAAPAHGRGRLSRGRPPDARRGR